jgi:ribosomal protein S12 methylthiotransferase
MSTVKRAPRVGMISLGCAKNLVDTEVMLGHLGDAGCAFVDDPAEADVIVVNTCGFIGPAREESIRTILEAAELKKNGRARRLVVAGCMVQRYADEMRESLPEVDAFVGLDELARVTAAALGELAEAPARPDSALPTSRSTYLYDRNAPRRRSTAPWTAFVKIAEGCDHTCSFCPIPNFRGAFRSRPVSDIVAEARTLAAAGVIEFNLVAQDSSHYGRDRGGAEDLADLLGGLDRVDGIEWVRVHYLYPNTVTDRLIEAMATLPRVVPYVDMPLQHAHPAMLKRMRRGGSGDGHLRLLERFRAAMPDAALRSTFIVGFPGETEEEFAELLAFVQQARFDHLGAFTYSHEEGTTAHALADDVAEEIKQERRERLMALQQTIVLDKLEERVGDVVEVLVEGTHPDTDLLLVGRMATQAPDVDGQVLINDGVADVGRIARVELTEVAGYDLVGGVVP